MLYYTFNAFNFNFLVGSRTRTLKILSIFSIVYMYVINFAGIPLGFVICVDLNHACSLSKQSLLKLSKIHISYKQWKSMAENFTLPAKQKVNFVIAWSRNFDFPLHSTFSFNFNACISISRQCYVILWDPNKLTINPLPLEAP